MPKRDPRLQKRGGTYYIRVKVPADLQAAKLIPKREFHYSLRTSELAEARRLLHSESVKIDAEIAKARRRLVRAPVRVLNQSDVEYLALDWFHAKDQQRLSRPNLTDPDHRDEAVQSLEHEAAIWADPADPTCLQSVQAEMRRLFEAQGIEIDTASKPFWSLFELMRRGMSEQTRRMLKQAHQDFTAGGEDELFADVRGDRALNRGSSATVRTEKLWPRGIISPK